MSSEHISGEIKTTPRKLNHRPEGIMPPVHPPLPGTIRFVDVQVYDVPAEDLPADLFSVESTLEPEEGNTQETPMQDEEPPKAPGEPTEHAAPTRARLHPLPFVLGMLCVLFAGAVSVVYVLPLLAPSATVTIIPDSRQITTHATVRVVTGVANSGQQQLQGRMLSSLTMSQAQTVPTTGMGHQDAQAAHGRITFYNAAPYGQTVPAGTFLTGTDRVQVVTDQDAVIPAVAYPTLGQVTVPAHAVTTGPGGNIRAGDIYGPCCRLNLSAVNAAFSGGQDARSYQMVTQQDINGIASSLKASLNQSVQAALSQQVQSDETLVTPIPCTSTVTPDHKAGEEASHVQIMVSEICTGEVYDTDTFHDLLARTIAQEAIKQLGEGYGLVGDIQTSITQVTMNIHLGIATLQVKVISTWMCQFSQAQQDQIKLSIRGKSKEEATALLLFMPGVQTVSISTRNSKAIPMDIQHIHLNFVIFA